MKKFLLVTALCFSGNSYSQDVAVKNEERKVKESGLWETFKDDQKMSFACIFGGLSTASLGEGCSSLMYKKDIVSFILSLGVSYGCYKLSNYFLKLFSKEEYEELGRFRRNYMMLFGIMASVARFSEVSQAHRAINESYNKPTEFDVIDATK